MRRINKHVHLQLGFTEFNTFACERNLEELVLSDEDYMVVPSWVEFSRGIRRFCGVERGMKAIQNWASKLRKAFELL